MGSLEEHLDLLAKHVKVLRENCPWLSGRESDGSYVDYGDKGALCFPGEKVASGRSALEAYRIVRHLEVYHLSECRDRIRERLSKERELPEETFRLLVKDLFEKSEEIRSCIACECEEAMSAHLSLEMLIDLLRGSQDAR